MSSLGRRGGCAVNKKSRSYLVPRRRGGQFGEMVRPEDSAGLTTPAAPFKGGFAIFSLMSRPPLLFKEGNLRADTPLDFSPSSDTPLQTNRRTCEKCGLN